VLFDALDGTGNFRAGIPLFCSAVAICIEGQPRVGAIFDPHHDCVYYASLPIELPARAFIWNIKSGSNKPIAPMRKYIGKPTIGFHIARNNVHKRLHSKRVYDELLDRYPTTYILNCGQLSLANVAGGAHTGFVNNYTSTWDVAAGEVLTRAVGGFVSRFNGDEIDYMLPDRQIDVVAAIDKRTHDDLLDIIRSVPPTG
jgi:myo-inositol-1(or 4)-monophosphatase